MSLSTYYASQLENLPSLLQSDAKQILEQLDAALALDDAWLVENADIAAVLLRVCVSSCFVVEQLLKTPTLLTDKDALANLRAGERRQAYAEVLAQSKVLDEASLMQALRWFRRREMVRIAWRDLSGWASLDETLLDLTALADACIQFALDSLYQQAVKSKGAPSLSDGTPFNLVVLGMGKLGAYELNYSSDIDLIFAYAENGELKDRQETSYNEFFTRLARNLVKVLDAQTVDGFVFRTDVRLRPFGDSGPLVMSFEGMEHYYQTQAREWERYAMVKVRQVAGDFNSGQQLLAMFKPFVYRRYLDYGAIDELRSLKYKITQELQRKDRLENIKLGPGGIREIEFIGQAFQLIRGGQEPRLQQRSIMPVLQTLGELKLLQAEVAAQLQTAYCFLRRVENHIQQYQDLQTHDLPIKPQVQAALAYSLDYPYWDDFKTALDRVRNQVHQVFDQVFAVSKQEARPQDCLAIWLAAADDASVPERLSALNFNDAAEVAKLLGYFKQSAAVRHLTAKGASVLERLMPQLLKSVQTVSNPDETLTRLLHLFEAVAGRNVYLSLLEENPDALMQLIKLIAASPWMGEYLAHYPSLFDELLDPRSLYQPLNKADLAKELQQRLQTEDSQDIEQVMIRLRKFKQINVLKVAAADIMGVLPLMVVSDYLTYIAEVVVVAVVDYAWDLLAQKHGLPAGAAGSGSGFGVLAYGKFGGIELNYSSDLDLVFIYDYPDGLAMTDGARPITSTQFYGRLGQQVRHILDTRMLSGILYEVDLRLRPNGDSGLLVANIQAYEKYLLENAWTWEHQALVRARFIAGDPQVKQQFEQIRQKVLALPRANEALQTEVREMREKMRQTLTSKSLGKFDLKQGKGGIADIEFIVQFKILAHAAQYQSLATYTDNMRLLDSLAEVGVMQASQVDKLKQAYRTYREHGHKAALQGADAIIEDSELLDLRKDIEQIWQNLMYK